MPPGGALFLQLIEGFDVLMENFRTGALDQWGLDLATLHARNPRLIVLRLTGFGQTGPYARRPGFARIFEAMSGFTHLTGEPDGPPQHMNYPLGDAVSGLFGAFAIATALAERNARPLAEQKVVEIDLSAYVRRGSKPAAQCIDAGSLQRALEAFFSPTARCCEKGSWTNPVPS